MANKQNCYCIVLSADSAYLPYTAVLITSILRQAAGSDSAPRLPFVFHILTDSASARLLAQGCGSAESQHFAAFCEAVERIYPCVILLHAMNEEESQLPFFADHKNHLNSYRLRLSSVIPNSMERVLYLDSDMLACTDVRELFALDLGEHIAAVVSDCMIARKIFLAKDGKKSAKISLQGHTYFNSGVLLLDYPRYIEENIEEQCFAILRNYKTRCHDQDALNITLKGKILYLPFAWNCTLHLPYYNDNKDKVQITRAEYESAKQAPNIIHYSQFKPWKSRFFYADDTGQPIVAPKRELWWESAAQTPVYGAILQHANGFDVEALDRLHSLAHALDIMQRRIDRLRVPSHALSQLWKKMRFWK